MTSASTRRHTHRDFESELRELKEALLAMGGRVEQMIGDAARALFARDGELAEQVREADRRVNDAELHIDSLVLKILARRQPMGSDLRFLTRALKMVTDIERAGDLAVKLGRLAHRLHAANRPDLGVHPGIERMAELVRTMIDRALDAFVELDAQLAREVIELDDQVDTLHGQVWDDTLEQMLAKPDVMQVGLVVHEAARLLERMGDHAVNFAEQVVFLVQAEDIRHPE